MIMVSKHRYKAVRDVDPDPQNFMNTDHDPDPHHCYKGFKKKKYKNKERALRSDLKTCLRIVLSQK